MDMNITKQTLCCDEILFEQTYEQAIDTDFTLPDYYPEIMKILKCRVVPKLNSKNLSGGSLNIDGMGCITLIYSDENNNICCFEHEINFQKNISLSFDSDEISHIDICLNNEYMNCRAVNERKMDIHGVISIKVKIYGTKHNEIITDIDKEHIQLKRGTLPATNPLGFSEKIVVIEEELELNNGNDCIKGVLRSDARAIIDECKIVTNKALIKGDIIVNALYCTEENTIEKYENRIPFNQILDINIEGIDCRCDGKVEIMSCLLKPRTNLSGQAKSFVFECKMSITATASCDNDIPIVFDAFSTIYETDLEMNMIEFKKLDSVLNERYMCKKTLEFNSDAFGSVIDMWCESKVSNARIINKNMTIVGTALICLLTYDKEGKPQYYERGVDFEYAHNIETTAENLTCQARLETVSSAYTILDSDKLEARIELSINADIFAVISKNVITGIGVNKENQKAKKKCPLTVYYADSGEDLWDIAKHYNSNCKNIKDINNLTDDILENATMLLIP